MIGLVLFATIPVILGVVVAGYLGATRGSLVLWVTLAGVAVLAAVLWGLQAPPSAPFVQRFVAPISVYLPPLLLAGAILSALGRPRWTTKTLTLLALGAGLANVFLAQFFFVLGCAAELWVCP
jgi:hypothetical protein